MCTDFSSLNSTKQESISSPTFSRSHKEKDLSPTSDSYHDNYLSHMSWGILIHAASFPHVWGWGRGVVQVAGIRIGMKWLLDGNPHV